MTLETENFLPIDKDVSLFYRTLGDAPGTPLIALNGGPGRSHQSMRLSPAWAELAQQRRMVFYDQRGTGRSTPLGGGISCRLADGLADLEALRAQLGAEQIDLVGHSWGGFLGMAYTARYPERVRRLVLVGSAAPRLDDTTMLSPQIFPEVAARRDELKFAWRLGDEEAFQESERLYRSLSIFSPERREAFLAAAGPAVLHFDVMRALSGDAGRFDLTPHLAHFTQPVLVTTGRYDLVVAPSVAYSIYKAIPTADFVVFEQSGHRPHFEEPDRFATVVNEFLVG